MKEYLVTLINKAMTQPGLTQNTYQALCTLLLECEYYEKQFNQFDMNIEDDLDAAIDLLCCMPMIVDNITKKEREMMKDAIRIQVPLFAATMEYNRMITSQNDIKFLA
ncbi:hypothetical protein ACXJY6_18755 [Vibrio sp. RC27]